MGKNTDNLGLPITANTVASRIVTAMESDGVDEFIVSANEVRAMAVALVDAYDVLTGFCGDERFLDDELNPMFEAFHTPVEGEK